MTRALLLPAALALLSGCAEPLQVAQQPVRLVSPVWASSYPIPVLAFDSDTSFAEDQVRFIDPDYSYHGDGRT